MQVVFESTESFSQEEFGRFVQERQQAGDSSHYELLNGRIVMNPPAGYPHGSIGSRVQLLIGNFVRERALGEVFDSSQGFDLPSGDTVEPDHSFVSIERWRAAPAPEHGKFLRVVPDLVVEVLSTRTASQDRGEKKAIYERNGVREYWLVDSRAQTLTAFLLEERKFDGGRTFRAPESYRSRALEGLEFDVSALFP